MSRSGSATISSSCHTVGELPSQEPASALAAGVPHRSRSFASARAAWSLAGVAQALYPTTALESIPLALLPQPLSAGNTYVRIGIGVNIGLEPGISKHISISSTTKRASITNLRPSMGAVLSAGKPGRGFPRARYPIR